MTRSRPAPHGRFAPSPTGELHVGNLRTALLAWLFARWQGARFLVRMEDLDAGRVRPGMEAAQLADLRALGLEWDGPVVRQSERGERYMAALERLDDDGLVYPCFCTRREIREAASAPHGAVGPYPGTCARLTPRERAARETAGRPPALRFRAGEAEVEIADELLGGRAFRVDDPVVRRNDGAFAYNLAVVVDDADQQIGQVVRGADLLDSTPRQVLLGRALGLREPRWTHVPLVLGPDGARLAKRHGAVTLADRRARGETPSDVRAALAASLGLAEPGERPDLADLVARFAPDRLPREPTTWIAD